MLGMSKHLKRPDISNKDHCSLCTQQSSKQLTCNKSKEDVFLGCSNHCIVYAFFSFLTPLQCVWCVCLTMPTFGNIFLHALKCLIYFISSSKTTHYEKTFFLGSCEILFREEQSDLSWVDHLVFMLWFRGERNAEQ